MSKESIDCKNCESSLEPTFEFCPNCGQKTKEELTVGVLFYNTISNYFAVDARFFKSFIPLMIKPGYLANKFIQGKRLLYLHPAQLYLFISIIFFFLYSFKQKEQINAIGTAMSIEEKVKQATDSISSEIEKDSVGKAKLIEEMKNNKEVMGLKDDDIKALDSIIKNGNQKDNVRFSFGFDEGKIDSLLAIKAPKKEVYEAMGMTEDDGALKRRLYAQMLKIYKNKGGISNVIRAFYDTVPISMFFLLPIFAFILKLLFFRRGRFAHHLVFTFYFFAYLFTVFSILIFISLLWDVIPGWVDFLIILSTFIYLFLAIKRFYGQGWFVSLFKSWVATVTFMVLVLPIAGGLMLVFAFMFY